MIPGNQAKIHKMMLNMKEAPIPLSINTANGGNKNAVWQVSMRLSILLSKKAFEES